MKRLVEFDLLKFLAILLVLWGHSVQYLLSSDYSDEPIYRYIYSFHMPLFMMISGFFFAMTTSGSFPATVAKKFRQLLLPALVWIYIFSFLKTFLSGIPSIKQIAVSFECGLWFLKSAFLCSLIGWFVQRSGKQKVLIGGGICVLLQLPVDAHAQISYMFPCFFVGMLLRWNYDKFTNFLSIPRNAGLILMVLASILIISNIFIDADIYRKLVAAYNRPLWSSMSTIVERVYRLFVGLSGSFFFVTLFIVIFKDRHLRKAGECLSVIGTETLGIYILQSYILEYLCARHLNFDDAGFVLFNFVIAPLISILVLILSFAIIRLIRQNKYLSFILLGASYPRSAQDSSHKTK